MKKDTQKVQQILYFVMGKYGQEKRQKAGLRRANTELPTRKLKQFSCYCKFPSIHIYENWIVKNNSYYLSSQNISLIDRSYENDIKTIELLDTN